LAVITFVAYQPAWRAGFIWDDDSHLTENLSLRSVDGLHKIWTKPGFSEQYYPLTFTGFWAEYHLWKLQPLGYHLVNILLHAVNAILLWRVLRRLEVPGAWLAAAIFALHPVEVESAAWITELKNVLSGMFSLLSVLAFFRFRPLSAAEPPARGDWRFYPVATLLFIGALLSKTAVCCLPVVVLVLIWWKQDRVTMRDVLALIPWFAASLILGLITVWVEHNPANASVTSLPLSIVEHCLLAGRVLWFYASKVFWPRQFTFVYPRWEIDAGAAWQYLFPVAALAVVIALWLLRRRIGKGPLAGVLCFAAMLMPVLGFCGVYYFRFSYVADHFQYLAGIGLITLATGTGATISQRAGRQGRALGALIGTIVLLMLGVFTWRQAHGYRNLETLWRDTLTKNPNAWLAHNNLSIILLQEGRIEDAIGHYEQALRLKPDYAEAHYNLGLALWQAGRAREAIAQYEQALRFKPDYAWAHNNLGAALLWQPGRVGEAIQHLEQALRITPDNAEAHDNLGVALVHLGRVQEAMAQWEQALRIRPDYAEAHCNLGMALGQVGKIEEAIAHYEQALRIKPDFAETHYNLGLALSRIGKIQDAIGHYEQALRLKPDYAEAHYNLGVALARLGRLPEAVGHWEQALRSRPNYAEAENNLAWLLATLAPAEGGDPVRAVTLAERACELTNNRVAGYLDTLAAAYAAAGRFNNAIATAQNAIGLARSAGQTQIASEIETRLELYRAGHPYREPAAMTSPRDP
jgi:tetratricopeptide (TPR) repeat protein